MKTDLTKKLSKMSDKKLIEIAKLSISEIGQRAMLIDLMDYNVVSNFLQRNNSHFHYLIDTCDYFRQSMDHISRINHQHQLSHFEAVCKALKANETPKGVDVSDYKTFIPALRSDAEELLNNVKQ